MDPAKRLAELVEVAKPKELPQSMSMEKCMQILNEIHQMGTFYAGEGHDEERAFILLLRYISIVMEELPRHPNFLTLSISERLALDAKAFLGMLKSEELKRKIRAKYEREMEQEKREKLARNTHFTGGPSTSVNGAANLPSEIIPDQNLHPYVRCQRVSAQSPIMFQRLIIPNNIPELFLSKSPQNDNNEQQLNFSLLYGRLVSKSLIISHLVPCASECIPTREFRRIVNVDGEDLPIVGCICSSLEKTCQIGFFRSCHISEMVCIVCPPGPNRTFVLHLVNMSPSGGSFHPQSDTAPTPSCTHVHITDSATATMGEPEDLLPNGSTGSNGAPKQPLSVENGAQNKSPLVENGEATPMATDDSTSPTTTNNDDPIPSA